MTLKNTNTKLLEALADARTAIRGGNVKLLECEIIDFYETGEDKNDGTLIQPLEIKLPTEDNIRRYVLRGEEAIHFVLGEPDDNNKFPKLEYNEKNVPTKGKVPDISPNRDGVYWFGLRKL